MKRLFLITTLLLLGVINCCFAQGVGTLDASFTGMSLGFNDQVYAIAIQTDGKIIVGGDFKNYNGANSPRKLVRLTSNGTLDDTFNMGLGIDRYGYVYTVATQADGKILAGGSIASYNDLPCPPNLIRLLPNGVLDDTFNAGTGFNGIVYTVVVLSNGKILVSGEFTEYNGIPCSNLLVRLNSDGTIDNDFNTAGSGFDGVPNQMLIQPDGKILVAGSFRSYNGVTCSGSICRLNENGSIDNTFNLGGTGFTGSAVAATVVLQADGKILVGGDFSSYNNVACPKNLIRLNTDGTRDNTFNSGGYGFNNFVTCLIVQKNGKIIVGGWFQYYNNVACTNFLTRLTSTGALDNVLNNGSNGPNRYLNTIVEQSDGKILVGGIFDQYNNITQSKCLARLNNGYPQLGEYSIYRVLADGAWLQGNIASTGGSSILSHGFCYSTSGTPTIADNHTSETGPFTTDRDTAFVSGMSPYTLYHVRAYADNSEGLAYGNEITFTTIPTLGEWGLIAFGSLIAVIGGVVVWRRFV